MIARRSVVFPAPFGSRERETIATAQPERDPVEEGVAGELLAQPGGDQYGHGVKGADEFGRASGRVSSRRGMGTRPHMATDAIILVGGGLAAGRLASEYRAAGGEAEVTILSAEPDPPYNRPPLTKGFLRKEQDRDSTFVRPDAEYEDDVVELRLETTVEAIHPAEHEVELAAGERVPYGTLVLATGARPRHLSIPGADLVGVHTYRTLADAEVVSAAADEAHSAIVIGGSFVGSETAASLRTRGLGVTLVEMGDTLMPQLRCADLSAQLVDLYRVEGVEV